MFHIPIRPRGILAAAVIGAVALTASGCSTEPSSTTAGGSDFPNKNITMIVPFDAGGSTDLSARTLASAMEDELGVSIIVENRAGGTGSVGLEHLAKAKADGYTFGILTVEAAMLGHQGYPIDPENYDVLGQVVKQTATIAVPANSPYKTLSDLIAAAKKAPGTISISNSGAGGNWESVTVALGEAAKVEFKPVPFDGGTAAVTAAMGDKVDAVIAGISETVGPHEEGQLRILAVLDDATLDRLPDVPTAQDQSVDIVMGSWHMIATPKGAPRDVVAAYEAAIKKAQSTSKFEDVITKSGNTPFYRSAADATSYLADESERFRKFYE